MTNIRQRTDGSHDPDRGEGDGGSEPREPGLKRRRANVVPGSELTPRALTYFVQRNDPNSMAQNHVANAGSAA